MQRVRSADVGNLDLRAGELVEVRSEAEILATLDDRGELDSLPFMPEMLQFCGTRQVVYKRAHKLCDTIGHTGMRRMNNAVHLVSVRCDGSAHDGCQTACLVYWKDAWLKRVDVLDLPGETYDPGPLDVGCTTDLLQAMTRTTPTPKGEERFSCQATELPRAAPDSVPLRDLSQFTEDVSSGNASWTDVVRTVLVGLFNRFQGFSKRALPPWLRFRGGRRWGFLTGRVTGRTPTGGIDLQPGELVRIKSKEQILETLDQKLHNRGMGFDEEMARFCGTTTRVSHRVEHLIDERTGLMLQMKSPCIVLENVFCAGVYNANCPRAFISFWREIWLERADEGA